MKCQKKFGIDTEDKYVHLTKSTLYQEKTKTKKTYAIERYKSNMIIDVTKKQKPYNMIIIFCQRLLPYF